MFLKKNSPNRGLRSSPDLDPDLGWPWKSYCREWTYVQTYVCTDVRTDVRMYGRTFFAGCIRSSLRRWPKNLKNPQKPHLNWKKLCKFCNLNEHFPESIAHAQCPQQYATGSVWNFATCVTNIATGHLRRPLVIDKHICCLWLIFAHMYFLSYVVEQRKNYSSDMQLVCFII